MALTVIQGDCREELRRLKSDSVHCCVSSPPYWGLRAYLRPWHPLKHLEIGQEKTPELFVATMVEVFREVRRVLRPDGTCWVNLGDSYCSAGGIHAGREDNQLGVGAKRVYRGDHAPSPKHKNGVGDLNQAQNRMPINGMKAKDLIGIPWLVALALRADGWYLRQDIIWHKPNPMPESVTDRCTKSHEYLFLLTKSERYYYDQEAIREPASYNTHERRSRAEVDHKSNPDGTHNGIRGYKTPDGWDTSKGNGGHGSFHKNGREKGRKSWNGSQFHTGKTGEHQLGRSQSDRKFDRGNKNNASFDEALAIMPEKRNKRSVWTIPSAPYKEAHFATFPPDLIKPCILAGCPAGGTVLDPFGGSGTTGEVALELGRDAILIELNPEYHPLIKRRTNITPGLAL